MATYYTIKFADLYGGNNYGENVYSCVTTTNPACTTSTGTGTDGSGTGTGSGSGLANTGTMVVAFVTLACIIAFVAMAVRIWRRKPQLATVAVDANNDNPPEEGPDIPSENPPRPL